ncbi:MAG: hypothetical protein ACTSXW_07050 [Candidatus Baldrarchaeia archaeon]
MSQEVREEKVAYTWRIEGDKLLFTVYFPSASEFEKLDIWEQAFWKTKLYEHILENIEKHDKLSYVFDVKGDKETFFKYLKKKFTSLNRKSKTTKAAYYFLFLWIVVTIIGDLKFWRTSTLPFPFNLVYHLTFLFILFLSFEHDRRRTIKLLNSIKRIQLQ